MANRLSVLLKTSTSTFFEIRRSLCSCSPPTLCSASQTCRGPSPSSSLRSWCDHLVTWSVVFWCTAPPQGFPKAMVLWSTWRRTPQPGPSQSSWGSNWGLACCMSTGRRWAHSRTHFCTPNVSVWTACPRACSPPKTSAAPLLILPLPASARLQSSHDADTRSVLDLELLVFYILNDEWICKINLILSCRKTELRGKHCFKVYLGFPLLYKASIELRVLLVTMTTVTRWPQVVSFSSLFWNERDWCPL